MPYADPKVRNMSTARRREFNAARRALLGGAVPPGFAARKVTTGPAGKVIAVQSVPEPFGAEHAPTVPRSHFVKGVSTLLDSQGAVTAQWVKTDQEKQGQFDLALAALEAHTARWAAAAPEPIPWAPNDTAPRADYQVTALLGDPHIGMMSWHRETGADWDLQIATKHMRKAVELLLLRAPHAGSLTIANLGDFFHAQDDDQRTPGGKNKMDVDSRSAKVLEVGYDMLRYFIDFGLRLFPVVRSINLPGNHDPTAARCLNKWLGAVYEKEPRVTIVPNEDPFIFETFGENLHMYHHGDGAPPERLQGIMATRDDGRLWGLHRYRSARTGHIHQMIRKDYPGMVWESSRTMSPADYWGHWKGFRAGRDMRTITCHKEFGPVHEAMIGVREVELALQGVL